MSRVRVGVGFRAKRYLDLLPMFLKLRGGDVVVGSVTLVLPLNRFGLRPLVSSDLVESDGVVPYGSRVDIHNDWDEGDFFSWERYGRNK